MEKQKDMKKKNNKKNDFLNYTICYLFIIFGVFFYYYYCGKSLIFSKDGIQQHFTFLMYERKWLRHILSTLWQEHRLDIPLFDMTIGYGSDILTTLHYYGITDPLTFFVAFLPKQSMVENFYEFLILFRIYLSGISFLYYCHTRKRTGIPSLCGTLIYCFSLWTIVGIRHPFFLMPLIYFPLILAGINRIFERKTPHLYIASLILVCISNFYFAYMICIFIILYAVWKYFVIEKKFCIRLIGYWISRFFLYSLTAIAISCFILLPVIIAVFDIERVNFKVYIPILYSLKYYIGLLGGYLTGSAGTFWSYLGYTGFGVFTLFIFFLKKHNKKHKILFIVLTSFLLFPIAGHIMNGFSYVVNRYIWAYTMLVSFLVVSNYPYFIIIAQRRKRLLCIFVILYSMFCTLLGIKSGRFFLYFIQVMLFLLLVCLVFSYHYIKKQKTFDILMCSLLCISLIAQGYFGAVQYSGGKELKDFADRGMAEDSMTTQCMGNLLHQIEDPTIWRYDHQCEEEKRNSSMALGLRGVNYYFSMTNGYISKFQKSVYLNFSRDYRYPHLTGRGMLDAFMSVKYFLTQKNCLESDYPNQFSEIVTENIDLQEKGEKEEKKIKKIKENKKVVVRQTKDYLPFGFTSDFIISEQTYQDLTPVQRQQALLQGIVVKESSFPEAELHFFDQKLEILKEKKVGLEWKKKQNKIVTKQGKKHKITVYFSGLPNSETYLVFKNLDYQDTDTKTWQSEPKDIAEITITCNGTKRVLEYRNSRNNFYSNIHDFIVNLGYRTESVNKMTIEFSEEGLYTYDDFYIVSQEMQSLHKLVQEMSQDSLQDIQFKTNQITGELELDKSKLLCMTIPYSTGWKVYIDGEEAKVQQADIGFLGVEVPKGSHKIIWKYQTPYLKIGIVLTMIGILIWIGIYIAFKRRKE